MVSRSCTRFVAATAAFTLALMLVPLAAMAQISVGISVNLAPPELPVYVQPPIPAEGYLWTPGYWAWDGGVQDYYWVPGTWVEAPQAGYLWTPGYWGSANGAFVWNAGYWGTTVGFYGGVNYGYGFGGRGYEGGYWQGGHLFYNTAVVNVGSVRITNVYNKTVINNVSVTRVSYNGGSGGVRAEPTAAEQAAAHEHHIEATSAQRQQEQTARSTPALRASVNKGNPPIAATARPGNFSGSGVVPAKHAETATVARVNPETHTSAPERTATSERTTTPERMPTPEHPATTPAAPAHTATPPRPVAPRPPVQAAPQEHQNTGRPATVEPRPQPAQNQAMKPAPKPEPRTAQPPVEHPAEHPAENEHH
jgi:hypothetical protein